jgi:DNA-binding helix-hairpin-helix protein with protein kinase domain
MRPLLEPGTSLKTKYRRRPIRIGRLVGGGGQGEVYLSDWDGFPCAVKWYKPTYRRQDGGLLERLKMLIRKGAPSNSFVWPEDVAMNADETEFGYVMPERETRFSDLAGYLNDEVWPTFTTLAIAGLRFAGAFLTLHLDGLSYRNISHTNLFFDPDNGDICICDNDNVDVDKRPGGILGSGPFMAPEIHRREALPSTSTDLYSLAVILFEMFTGHHPLYGRRLGLEEYRGAAGELKLLGTQPLFIFDPRNRENEPDPALDSNPLALWPVYPAFFRDRFVQAFTKGLASPEDRVTDREWQRALARLRDSIFPCPSCGMEVFYDAELYQATRSLTPCWNCRRPLLPPARMRVNGHTVMLAAGAELYPHHVEPQCLYDYSRIVAKVSGDGTRCANQSAEIWTVRTVSGEVLQAAPGDAIVLADCASIHFGKSGAEVKH